MITGESKNTLDEKGRILIPSKLRNDIESNILIVTRGVDKCLWLFPPSEWEKISIKLMSGSILKRESRILQRRIIAPAQECEIDKAGRINIPPTLRESAGLKKDTIILGIEKYLEIWDEGEYNLFLDSSEAEFNDAAENYDSIL